MKKKVILPYEMNVESVAYQNQAFALGMIKPNIQNFDLWLCNKYINSIYGTSYDLYDEDVWTMSEGLTVKVQMYMIYEAFQSFCPDIVQKNKEMLEQEYYIWGTYDEYFIPGKWAYQKQSNIHGYLIYGYDDEEGVFKSAGYLKDGFYKRFDIKYEDYYESIRCRGDIRLLLLEYCRVNKEYKARIDVDKIKEKLTDYLYSKEYPRQKKNEIFGIACWEHFCSNHIGQAGGSGLDMRYARAYMEHKGIMSRRLRCLQENGYISDKYLCQKYEKEVCKAAEIVYNLFIKYNMTGNEEIRKRITGLVHGINEREKNYIEKVIASLQSTPHTSR